MALLALFRSERFLPDVLRLAAIFFWVFLHPTTFLCKRLFLMSLSTVPNVRPFLGEHILEE